MYYFIVLLTVTRLLFQTVPVLSAPSSVANSENSWPSGEFGYDLGVNIGTSSLNNNATVAVRKEFGPDFVEVVVDRHDGLIEDVLIGDKSFIGRLLREYYPELAAYLEKNHYILAPKVNWPSGKLGDDLGVNIASGFKDMTVVVAVQKDDDPDFVKVRVASENGLIKDVLIGDKSFIGQLLKEYYPVLDAFLKKRHVIGASFPDGKFGYDLGVNIASGFDDNTSVVAVRKDDGPDFVKVRINDYNAQIKDVLIGDKSFIGRPLEEYYPALADYLKQQHAILPSM